MTPFLYLLIGFVVVWVLSTPHRRDGYPHVPALAWLLAGILWPLTVVFFVAFVVRYVQDRLHEIRPENAERPAHRSKADHDLGG